jgi:hypothetical protein
MNGYTVERIVNGVAKMWGGFERGDYDEPATTAIMSQGWAIRHFGATQRSPVLRSWWTRTRDSRNRRSDHRRSARG